MSGFRQSQAALHTWSGLLVGWALFTIFLAGTVSYWREDINRWMRPELPRAEPATQVAAGAIVFLQKAAPDAANWFITLPGPHDVGARVFWQPQPSEQGASRKNTQALVGADGQPVHARDTRGGEFFYRFHFDLQYVPVIWARWFVGFCAMMMFVAIISGVITHKKIFKDFFTLRRAKGQRSWLDGHGATAVLALPFHLMITYTGLVTLMTLYMPWAAVANYSNTTKLFEVLFPASGIVERTGRAAALVDIAPLMRDARMRWNGAEIGSISIAEPGDAAARIIITQSASDGVSARRSSITYAGATGHVIRQLDGASGAAEAAGVMIGLHAGRYAPDTLRWLYFLSGIGGTVMIASGLVLWTVKRREKLPDPTRPHFGFRLVERLNIGFIAGLPLAMTGYLWANRLLPVDMAGRADWEVHMMFIVWGGALLFACIGRTRPAWIMLIALSGAALVGLPIHDLGNDRGIIHALGDGDLRMATMNLVLLAGGIGFLAIARKVQRYRPKHRSSRGKRATYTASTRALLEAAE